jgi:ferredoxin-NADP reductase
MMTSFQLIERVQETPSVQTLRLRSVDGQPFLFQAGSFGLVSILGSDIPPRAFSFSSAPDDPLLELAVERTGKMTTELHRIPLDTTLRINGPRGRFVLPEPSSAKIVMIAGGSGIAPLRSMLRVLRKAVPNPALQLIYSVRTPLDIIFREELESYARDWRGFMYHPTVTRPIEGGEWKGAVGRLNSAVLQGILEAPEASKYFVCGSPTFVFSIIQALLKLGVDREQIRTEQWLQPDLG